jgi:acetylglutamate kinase
MFEKQIEKAETLVEALPYIKKFRGETIVIKYGGSIMNDDSLKKKFASDIVLLKYVGINPVVVHGGGKEISRWMEKIGKEPSFVDGQRVTDAETMEITEMVLSGKINNEIVTLINSIGGNAVGLSGKDANLFTAKKITGKDQKDLGFVGEIVKTNEGLLNTLQSANYIPVVSSVGQSLEGETLNMNADNVAAGLAIALHAQKLIYLTDIQGISKEGKFLEHITLFDAEELLNHPDIKGGMKPKLSCSVKALQQSVKDVHIINGLIAHAVLLEVFTDYGIGTMISR